MAGLPLTPQQRSHLLAELDAGDVANFDIAAWVSFRQACEAVTRPLAESSTSSSSQQEALR